MNSLEIDNYVMQFAINLRNSIVENNPNMPYEKVKDHVTSAAENYRLGFIKALHLCGGDIVYG